MQETQNNNRKLSIATAGSRNASQWKNGETLWGSLTNKLSKTYRGPETQEEFFKMPKTRQDELKDVGGFVGGYLVGGKRNATSVLHRSVLTLDADFATPELWLTLTTLYDNAALIYSTRKHTPEKPRLRVVMPLSHDVDPVEYQAIARRIADNLGINQFDHTGYQPERLMYWPSTSSDAEYVFEVQDGPWLDVDEVLASYRNYLDTSEWPLSDREGEIVLAGIKKAGDPFEKGGVIEAWCRTYDIHAALEMTGEYIKCGKDDNRYTYTGGTTSAGVVTYEDKHAFSHHSSGPISNKLVNAFDLFRLHKFPHHDEGVAPGTPVHKLPSYAAMVEYATKDPAVRQLLVEAQLAKATKDFDDLDVSDLEGETASETQQEDENTEWMKAADVDAKGRLKPTTHNILLILRNDRRIKQALARNLLTNREVIRRDFLNHKLTPQTQGYTDADDSALRCYLETVYGICAPGKIADALSIIFAENAFHPVKDYLEKCAPQWDGLPRIDTLLIDYLGAENTEYVRAVTRKTLIAAVARIFQPGCKYDTVLTLVGSQGIGKSTLFRKLGGAWFSDSFSTFEGNRAYEQLQGVWLIEMGELAGHRRAEIESVKHFISKQEDIFRPAYGKRVETFPRQCVFLATTNDTEFLKDGTGNRRFWPVTVKGKGTYGTPHDLTADTVTQIWAEAVAAYKNGEPLHLAQDIEAQATEVQAGHLESHPWAGTIKAYLETPIPTNWEELTRYDRQSWLDGQDVLAASAETRPRNKVAPPEIFTEALRRKIGDMTRADSMAIHSVMRSFSSEWEAKVLRHDGSHTRGYIRINVHKPPVSGTVPSRK
jgi:predicted P-loop ATPase